MSAPQTARERFEAWLSKEHPQMATSFDLLVEGAREFMFEAWQAAERSAIERAAKVAEEKAGTIRGKAIAQAIRSLIT